MKKKTTKGKARIAKLVLFGHTNGIDGVVAKAAIITAVSPHDGEGQVADLEVFGDINAKWIEKNIDYSAKLEAGKWTDR